MIIIGNPVDYSDERRFGVSSGVFDDSVGQVLDSPN